MDLGWSVSFSYPGVAKETRDLELTASALSAREVPTRIRGVESSITHRQPDANLH